MVFLYSDFFYKFFANGSKNSAREIVPLINDLIKPKSVIDVGCGLGTWLSVFKEHGVDDFLGLDGEYVNQNILQIPKENFRAVNLEDPISIDRKFDLVVCVEVAEHLSRQRARMFVRDLTNLGPVVLFSAAIPWQIGRHHVNNQWPDYWIDLFETEGYQVIDCIREAIIKNQKVEWWYAQNIFLFVHKDYLAGSALLQEKLAETRFNKIRRKMFLWYCSIVLTLSINFAKALACISIVLFINQIPFP